MLFALCQVCEYAMRTNVSVAVTALPDRYDWNTTEYNGPILSAFWVGYTVMQVPTQAVAVHFGALWPPAVPANDRSNRNWAQRRGMASNRRPWINAPQ